PVVQAAAGPSEALGAEVPAGPQPGVAQQGEHQDVGRGGDLRVVLRQHSHAADERGGRVAHHDPLRGAPDLEHTSETVLTGPVTRAVTTDARYAGSPSVALPAAGSAGESRQGTAGSG